MVTVTKKKKKIPLKKKKRCRDYFLCTEKNNQKKLQPNCKCKTANSSSQGSGS